MLLTRVFNSSPGQSQEKFKIFGKNFDTLLSQIKDEFPICSLFGPAWARSYMIIVVGNWFVGNAVFSETAKDFSDFLHEVRGL